MTQNFTGVKFNNLTIVEQFVGKDNLTNVECVCDCGRHVKTLLTVIRNSRKKSCKKCQTRGKFKPKAFGEASFNALYSNYKANAKYRGIEFELSKEQVKQLFDGNCFYCGAPPTHAHTNKRFNGQALYNGIDRKNPLLGYELQNCVSCCKFCNYAKKDVSFEEYIKWIRDSYNNTKHLNL